MPLQEEMFPATHATLCTRQLPEEAQAQALPQEVLEVLSESELRQLRVELGRHQHRAGEVAVHLTIWEALTHII